MLKNFGCLQEKPSSIFYELIDGSYGNFAVWSRCAERGNNEEGQHCRVTYLSGLQKDLAKFSYTPTMRNVTDLPPKRDLPLKCI